MMRIVSPDNSRFKLVKKLYDRKHRDSEGLFVIEGVNAINEAIVKGADIRFALVCDEREDLMERLDESGGFEVFAVPGRLFDRLADAENGSGVIAVVTKPAADVGSLISADSKENCILILDRLQDPGNMGTIIRTAVAAGYSAIVAIRGTVDVYSPKVVRATAGMIFDMPVVYVRDAEEAARIAGELGKRVVVTSPSDGVPYFDAELSAGIALVIGNEGSGISDEMMRLADEKVTIPMSGDIESLNAAVSAAILMYEKIRNSER